ncbi:hypothetical protein K7432_014742 [Basidiobolus ranarum]|uniref:Uncharacterized protein n=1 Tax=Basidiobolus ranarum TaxID=34480 RepID=A0ABR2VP49_9FUNG
MKLQLIVLLGVLLVSGSTNAGEIMDRLRTQQEQLPYKYNHVGSLKRRGDESAQVSNFREALAAQMEHTRFKYNFKEVKPEKK